MMSNYIKKINKMLTMADIIAATDYIQSTLAPGRIYIVQFAVIATLMMSNYIKPINNMITRAGWTLISVIGSQMTIRLTYRFLLHASVESPIYNHPIL
jgi:hypothetical protein